MPEKLPVADSIKKLEMTDQPGLIKKKTTKSKNKKA
jgi:hypothetical protein